MTDQNVLSYLDAYCERAGDAGVWAEPLNAVTNIAFMIAAVFAARALRGHPFKTHWDLWLLTITLFSIGVGSGLWHTYATQQTMLADVIPIGIFIHLFLISSLRRAARLGWVYTLLGLATFVIVGDYAAQTYLPPDLWHGSVMYLPAVSALAILTIWLKRKDFAIALGLFLISIAFRTIDTSICSSLPIGTHFLWHVLNAYVLYRLVMALVHRA